MGESNWSLNSLSSHLTDHFVVLANVSRAEVDEDVDDEHDVHCDGGWNGMEGKEGRMIRAALFKHVSTTMGPGYKVYVGTS